MSGDEDFETADEDHGLRFTENTRVPRPRLSGNSLLSQCASESTWNRQTRSFRPSCQPRGENASAS